jgi:IclR family transcriptional regulator, KDG regulon repressor
VITNMDRKTLEGCPPALAGTDAKANTRLSSVSTAIALLKSFSESDVEMGISQLAKRLGVAKSTTHRLAMTLVSEGLLEQNLETGRYRLGISLFRLGSLVRQRMDISTEARPHLFALRESTGETVNLALLDGPQIMYVYNLESAHAIRMRSDVGVCKPAFCTAEGLVMLAFRPSAQVEVIIARGLKARTTKTRTDPRELRAMLDEVRARGYAIEDELSEEGMRAIAAPLHNSAGDVVAAIGIAGPVQRLWDGVLAAYVPKVVETSRIISARLGYRPRP